MKSEEDVVRPGLWAKKKQIPGIKKRLRAKVPFNTEYKIEGRSSYDVILNYLLTNGFHGAANFLELLFERERYWNGSKTLPKELLAEIVEVLKDIEKEEATPFDLVSLALSITERAHNLYWVSKKLFQYALELASKVRSDGGYIEAKVRYAFGKFLYKENDPKAAFTIAEEAYDLALGKSWYSLSPTRKILSDIPNLLFESYIKEAQKYIKRDLAHAMMLSKKAVKYSLEANNKYAPSKAYLLCGRLEMDTGNYDSALEYFKQGIQHAQVISIHDDICKINLLKTTCFTRMQQYQRALACARLVIQRANSKNLPYYIGKSLLKIGRVDIMEKDFAGAGSNYVHAFQLFGEIRSYKGQNKARCRLAYALALRFFPLLLELLYDIEKTGRHNSLKRLMLWKERQLPFWDANCKLQTYEINSYDMLNIGRFDLNCDQLGTCNLLTMKNIIGFDANRTSVNTSKKYLHEYREFLKNIYFYV